MLVRLGFDDDRDERFDCGDDDLNDYFFNDSRKACQQLVAVTYAYIEEGRTRAFFSVSNDSINREELTKAQVKKIAHGKRYSALPAVKIGRLAIDLYRHRQGLGSELIDFIKDWFTSQNKTGCRFIVVDAYNNDKTLRFYTKNGFSFALNSDQKNNPSHTKLMLFDLSLVRE